MRSFLEKEDRVILSHQIKLEPIFQHNYYKTWSQLSFINGYILIKDAN